MSGLKLEIHRRKSIFGGRLQVRGWSGPGTRSPPPKIFFLGRTTSYRQQRWSPPPKIFFSGRATSYRLCRAWNSKYTAENRFLVADFKSEAAAGVELEIRPRKSFCRVGLWVIGCSGPRTQSPPPKIDFSGPTTSYRRCRAWNSKFTAENTFLVADFKSEAAAGPELEICPRKSFFRVRLRVIGSSGPRTWSPPLKIDFSGRTTSYRLCRAWNSKYTTENQFLVADFNSEGAAGPEFEIHGQKSFFQVGLWVIGSSGPQTRSPRIQLARSSKATPELFFFGSDYNL